MKNGKPIIKTVGTVVTAVVVLTLVILSIVLSGRSFTENQSSTLYILLIICGCSVLYCFTAGEITQNFSQMDKLWSILPIAYVWVVAGRGGMDLRLVIYALIVTAWGIRLTVNFARKGAYSIKFWEGKEDYRWSVVHGMRIFRKRIAWTAFNLFFISLYQNVLVLAICFPALACMGSDAPIGAWDIAAAVSSVMFLTLETVADEYQWKFHKTKKKLLSESGSLDRLPPPYDIGFNTTGPWSVMRHPNYLGEQGIWLCLYMFAIGAGAAEHGVFHWSAVGPLMLVLLFMGSSALGETISSNKYPLYKDYAGHVYKYLPLRRYKRPVVKDDVR